MVGISLLFSQICTIQKKVAVLDSVGRPSSYTLTDVHTSVRCRHDPLRFRSRERTEAGASQAIMQEMIFTEYFDDITADMLVLIGTQTYEIISVNTISNNVKGHHLELEVVHSENV